jgi:hypothetical protein
MIILSHDNPDICIQRRGNAWYPTVGGGPYITILINQTALTSYHLIF